MGHSGARETGHGLMGSGSAAPLPKAGAVLPPWAVQVWWHTGHSCRHPLPGPSPKGITLRGTRRGRRLGVPGLPLAQLLLSTWPCPVPISWFQSHHSPRSMCSLWHRQSLSMRAPPPVGSWTALGWRGRAGNCHFSV